MNKTLEYGNIPFGPYVMRTKIPEDMRKRLLKDGKKDLKSYHKSLAGHLHTQLKYNDKTTKWFYQELLCRTQMVGSCRVCRSDCQR